MREVIVYDRQGREIRLPSIAHKVAVHRTDGKGNGSPPDRDSQKAQGRWMDKTGRLCACESEDGMRYLSLFSGIEACSVAWEPLGWKPVAFAEWDDFPKAVLRYHWPDVPDLDDVTKITAEDLEKLGPFELIVGGSPCQDLSVAGKRAGLRNEDGSLTRSGLFDHQMRIFELARRYNNARWLLWENVPGALSSNSGQDFAYVLGTMVQGDVPVPRDGWGNSGVCVSESYLSPRACRGILSRAERHHKELPDVLMKALTRIAEGFSETSSGQPSPRETRTMTSDPEDG